jgi:signal peptide peptidase SppA
MKYQQILSAFFSTPWAILPEKLAEIRAFLRMKADGGELLDEQVQALAASRRPDGVQMVGRVAVLPVFGTISQRVGMLERASGGVSTEELGASLDSLVSDKAVKSIVMVYDSPGGSVPGVQELAAKIRAARDQKKIVGFIDPCAASAAYWLISQSSEIVCTPSGQAGCVGVLYGHTDYSKADEMDGITTTLIASAPYKAELWQPLTDEAKANLQKNCNAVHAQFVADIAKGRGISESKVDKTFGQGRTLNAEDALAAGMIDRIGTMDKIMKQLGATDTPSAEARRNQAIARARAIAIEG